ncbi:MAG: hypothetical protein R3F14_36410 [Polyangiaceae bacterium]
MTDMRPGVPGEPGPARAVGPRAGDVRAGAGELGAVFFEVEDALAPRYRHLRNFGDAILATTQRCFWNVLTGD